MTKVCPFCKRVTRTETVKYCYFDGHKLDEVTYVCQGCSAELGPHDRFCEYCGTKKATVEVQVDA